MAIMQSKRLELLFKLFGVTIMTSSIILFLWFFVLINRPVKTGSLVLVGGGSTPTSVKDKFVELAGGKKAEIVVIPSASATPGIHCLNQWQKYGTKSLSMLHAESREQADDPAFYLKLRKATGVWFSGGDQDRLMSLYHNTSVEKELHEVLRRGGVIGGTSAGASAVSNKMMSEGEAHEGFALTNIIIDQHFNTRKRLPRLQNLLEGSETGIGIDESTAIIIKDNEGEVIGEGEVTVCKDKEVKKYQSGQKFKLP